MSMLQSPSAHDLHHTVHSFGKLRDEIPTSEPHSTPTPAREVHSTHLDLDVRGAATEIRRDYLHEYYVLVAPKRAGRPYDTAAHDHPMVESASSPRLDLQTSVLTLPKNQTQAPTEWQVKVVENKYPALTLDNPKAFGAQEIVIDTPLSNTSFADLDPKQIELILQAYQARSEALLAQEHIKYVSIFRNDGYEAGASLAHAHSQIIGLPILPPDLVREAEAVTEYATHHETDAYSSIIGFEQRATSRVITENEDWIAFCPYASRWQMEAWIIPKIHVSLIQQVSSESIASLSPLLGQLSKALTGAKLSYNLVIEQGTSQDQRLIVKLCGRNVVSPWGGLEVGTGMIVNVIPPESAAAWYRKQARSTDL